MSHLSMGKASRTLATAEVKAARTQWCNISISQARTRRGRRSATPPANRATAECGGLARSKPGRRSLPHQSKETKKISPPANSANGLLTQGRSYPVGARGRVKHGGDFTRSRPRSAGRPRNPGGPPQYRQRRSCCWTSDTLVCRRRSARGRASHKRAHSHKSMHGVKCHAQGCLSP